MNKDVILQKNIKLNCIAKDWMDAIRQSAQLLVDSNFITKDYVDLTIKIVEDLGPYIVIAPGLALAHARPDVSVLKTGISLITLTEPINFNSDNDPVKIVLTLAAKNDSEHLEMLQKVSCYLSEDGKMEYIGCCTNAQELAQEINEYNLPLDI